MKRLIFLFAILSIFLLAYGTANASEVREKDLAAYIDAVTDTALETTNGSYDFKTVSEAVTAAQDEHSQLFRTYFRRVQNDVKRKNRWSSLNKPVVRKTKKVLLQSLHTQITLLVGLTNKNIADFEAALNKEVTQ